MSCSKFIFPKSIGRSRKDGENKKIAIKLESPTAPDKLLAQEIELYQFLESRKFRQPLLI